ncbi:MAG: hypothetical protein OSA45_16855 [Halioglobus sp.]|jgi:hypothetical protein|nr:hypothetical protein [Halioglobus sp.]
MEGWKWASRADVTALFDYYIRGSENRGCYGGHVNRIGSTWAPALFIDGMRPGYTTDHEARLFFMVADVDELYSAYTKKIILSDYGYGGS